MRRQLVLVFLAISILITGAFVVPLVALVGRTAEDRAIDVARADTAAIVPALISGGSRAQVESAVGATRSGQMERMTVYTWSGWTIGPHNVPSERVEIALASGASNIGEIDTGFEVVAAVSTGPGEFSAIRVAVPTDELTSGRGRALAALATVGIALIAISVLVADRLARNLVRPTQALAAAASRLGDGELEAKVSPSGPPEVVALGEVFNELGTQVADMLNRERELVADLSHRLRTPLTKLRLRLDEVSDPYVSSALRADLAEMTEAVNGIIQEARGALTVPPECDLAEVVAERAEFWQVLAEDQRRPWLCERSRESLLVAGPRSDLAAAVDVLLENVFSHTPEGGSVSVGCTADNGFAEVWVADSGGGINEAALARGESSRDSTGLGLDIARKFASQAGGSFGVSTSDLGGAEVRLTVPLVTEVKETSTATRPKSLRI